MCKAKFWDDVYIYDGMRKQIFTETQSNIMSTVSGK